MINYSDSAKNFSDAITSTTVYSDEQKEMLHSFAEHCRGSILLNIRKGGKPEDEESSVSFIAFMSMVNHYLHQEFDDEMLRLYFEPIDKSIDYGRNFYERLIGRER